MTSRLHEVEVQPTQSVLVSVGTRGFPEVKTTRNGSPTHLGHTRYPYLLPNLVGACLACVVLVLVVFCLKEEKDSVESPRCLYTVWCVIASRRYNIPQSFGFPLAVTPNVLGSEDAADDWVVSCFVLRMPVHRVRA